MKFLPKASIKILGSKTIFALVVILSWLLLSTPIAQADSLIIQASVPAKASDFQLSIASDHGATIGTNTTITYSITYGWLPSHATDMMVIQAQWNLLDPNGQIIPVHYVENSASLALGQYPAVVDVDSRTITWTISPVPPGSNRKVTFVLRTISDNVAPIQFNVSARIIGPGIALPWQNLLQTYDPSYVPPVPTVTSSPTSTIAPSGTPSIQPSTVPSPSSPPTGGHITPPPIDTSPSNSLLDIINDLARGLGGLLAIPLIGLIALISLLTLLTSLSGILTGLSWWYTIGLLLSLLRLPHRPWGVIFDANTGQPLKNALITLTSAYGQTYQTISDALGHYQFDVSEGIYLVSVSHANFATVSNRLNQSSSRPTYSDTYVGHTVEVDDTGTVTPFNIGMESLSSQSSHQAIPRWLLGLQRFQWPVLGLGLIWTVTMVVLYLSLINILAVSIYALAVIVVVWYRYGFDRPSGHSSLHAH